MNLSIVPRDECERIERMVPDRQLALAVLADVHRANAIAVITAAGSGHLGTSLSSLDLVTWLYYAEMNVRRLGSDAPDRDIYLSSKGHDAPGHYAVLYGLGILDEERFTRLRRLGGTPGHPDVSIPGIEANTGSLGMGISKGVGFALAKRRLGRGGHVYVLTGDGEFQEGQIYEALMTAAAQRLGTLTVIVDSNKVQSDKLVNDICSTGDTAAVATALGWHVDRCNGHEMRSIDAALSRCRRVTDRPTLILAETIKGRGVGFMEHPAALRHDDGIYRWHSGAPDAASFARADQELMEAINRRLAAMDIAPVERRPLCPREGPPPPVVDGESVGAAYGRALLDLATDTPELVVLDADLAADCHVRAFEVTWPERFFEFGIAEQDMVSAAGAMARQGLLPVVNSFAAFLTARANEQIANNASEQARVIYAAHYAGLTPAGPGASHQSVRDISLMAALPDVVIVQPSSPEEARMATAYAVRETRSTCVLRMNIGSSRRRIVLPNDYRLTLGRGVVIAGSGTASSAMVAYGPVMLAEALDAHELLASEGIACDVINMPWLNRLDEEWCRSLASRLTRLLMVEDHATVGGLGDHWLRSGLLRADLKWDIAGVEGPCACGTNAEALRHHKLDARALARRLADGRRQAPS